MDPFLTYSNERELRKKVWTTYYARGDNNDEYDNKAIIAKILRLRKERVALLGYDNYADWRLQNRMAKTAKNAMDLMNAVWPSAINRVKEEVLDMQAIANNLDSDEVKQYLQLGKLREAMFFVAGELFNFKFTSLQEGKVPVFHKDVKVWEVTFDGKQTVLCSNNSNFVKPAEGEAVLVSWDDATTFFHEFGHALHFLAANVRYPTLNGGVRDYTEFQSQLLERWLSTDKVISNYLVHYKTAKPMPKALVDKIKKASTFNQGFGTTEYLASALMDMKLHLADPTHIDIAKFEKETLAALKMPKELVMRHRTPQFGHVFSGEGYATGYYGYIWADVLTADAAYLFAPRNAMDPAEAYKKFRGREANIEALMRDRGFAPKN